MLDLVQIEIVRNNDSPLLYVWNPADCSLKFLDQDQWKDINTANSIFFAIMAARQWAIEHYDVSNVKSIFLTMIQNGNEN